MVGAQDATTFRKLILAYLLALSTTADINDITLDSQYVYPYFDACELPHSQLHSTFD